MSTHNAHRSDEQDFEPVADPSGKAAGAFRTISEVADDLNVPQHVLRFWETRFFQVRPLKRGGGRRYYRPEDVALLKKIHFLLYSEGYTIKGVQKLLKGVSKAQLLKEQGVDKPGPLVDAAQVVNPPANQDRPAIEATIVPETVYQADSVGVAPLTATGRAHLEAALDELRAIKGLLAAV